jgi:hypothetical protein
VAGEVITYPAFYGLSFAAWRRFPARYPEFVVVAAGELARLDRVDQ